MKKLFNTLFLNNRLFFLLEITVVLFVLGFFITPIFIIAKAILLVICLLTFIDIFLLFFGKTEFSATRKLPEKLSNSDNNKIYVKFKSEYNINTFIEVIEELPFQFQKRDFKFNINLKPSERKTINYDLKPTERGVYSFGNLNAYVSSNLKLVSRKFVLAKSKSIKCYPSFLKLKEFNFKAFSNQLNQFGSKKIRRIGQSLEFEQIKEYVSGDDIRTLNWKATAKKNQLMVNQFIDEKSQPIYSIIDKGRVMKMPFNELSLLDYAINSTLAFSNIAVRKKDRVGMLTFSKKIDDFIVAEQRNSQMKLILESLYNVKTDFKESDYSLLYATIKRKITNRSLIILYSNFETVEGLKRQLPYLRAIAKSHLLLVVFFKNTELDQFINNKTTDIQKVYDKIIAEKFRFEKKKIVKELKKYGIHSILTEPENLAINTITKYLKFKTKGLI